MDSGHYPQPQLLTVILILTLGDSRLTPTQALTA